LRFVEAVTLLVSLIEDGEVRAAHGLGVAVLFGDLRLERY